MPEVAVKDDRHWSVSEDDVGTRSHAWLKAEIHAISQFSHVQAAPDSELRSRNVMPVAEHCVAPRLTAYPISQGAVLMLARGNRSIETRWGRDDLSCSAVQV